MFSLHDFIMRTLEGMIGHYPDFQVMEFALNWYERGKLTEEDLAEIELMLMPPVEEVPEETLTEDIITEESTEVIQEEPTEVVVN